MLRASGITINTEFLCRYRTIVGVNLSPDIGPTTSSSPVIVTATAIITPSDDKAAILKASNLGLILVPGELIGINPELANSLIGAGIEDTRPIVLTLTGTGTIASIVAATGIVAPGHGKPPGIELSLIHI